MAEQLVAIVGADVAARRMAARRLRDRLGVHVITVAGGADDRAMIERLHPALVLDDVAPYDGEALVTMVRERLKALS